MKSGKLVIAILFACMFVLVSVLLVGTVGCASADPLRKEDAMPHTDSATVDAQVPSNPHVVRYTGLPATWCDGLLLGNGEIGVRCWSDDKKLKFTLDSASAWDLRLEDGWLERCGFTYAELCELVGKRDFDALKKASKRGRSVYGVGPTKTPPTEVGHQAARRSRVSTARVKFLR